MDKKYRRRQRLPHRKAHRRRRNAGQPVDHRLPSQPDFTVTAIEWHQGLRDTISSTVKGRVNSPPLSSRATPSLPRGSRGICSSLRVVAEEVELAGFWSNPCAVCTSIEVAINAPTGRWKEVTSARTTCRFPNPKWPRPLRAARFYTAWRP